MAKNNTQTSYAKGIYAETLASLLLRAKGYRILEQRYRTPCGEIDMIAKRGKWLCFIEVKARPNNDAGLYAVQPKAQQRIMRSAEIYIAQNPGFDACNMRFDVITCVPGQLPQHHENMWQNDQNEL